jgi:hypothetical protein
VPTDRISKVLKKVARECVSEVMNAYGLCDDLNEACERELEARLGSLLRAVVRANSARCSTLTNENKQAVVAKAFGEIDNALATLEGRE